jgi:excisionase family DNA binding protein
MITRPRLAHMKESLAHEMPRQIDRPGVPRPAIDAPQPYEPLLLRPVEAARLLGIGRSKLFEMLPRDELSVIRIGRCVRIPRRELARWVEQSLEAEIAVRDAFLGVRETTTPRT